VDDRVHPVFQVYRESQVNLARTVCKATEVSPDCQERLDHLVPTVPKVSKVYLDPVDLTVWEWKDQLDRQDPKDLPDLPASASPADPVSVVIPANQVRLVVEVTQVLLDLRECVRAVLPCLLCLLAIKRDQPNKWTNSMILFK